MTIKAAINFSRFSLPNPNDANIITSCDDIPTYVGVSLGKGLPPIELRIKLLKLLVGYQPHITFIPSNNPFEFVNEISRLHNGYIDLTLLFGVNRNALAIGLQQYNEDIVKNITLIPEHKVMSDVYIRSLYNNNDYDKLTEIYTPDQLTVVIDICSR